MILGSTGSIGTQALDVVRRNPERFRVAGLAPTTTAAPPTTGVAGATAPPWFPLNALWLVVPASYVLGLHAAIRVWLAMALAQQTPYLIPPIDERGRVLLHEVDEHLPRE